MVTRVPVAALRSRAAARLSSDVVALACEHGALVHGFTPVWYSAERRAAIAAVVAGPRG